MTSEKWEIWYPRIGAVAAAVGSYMWMPGWASEAIRSELLKDATALGAVLVGFLAASQAVLATVASSDIVAKLKAAGGYEYLVGYFSEGIATGLVLVLSSAILRLPPSDASGWWLVAAPLWIGIAIWTTLATVRVMRIFSKVLKRV